MVDMNEVDELEFEKVVRPIGRDKAKKRGSSSNTSRIERGNVIQKVVSNFEMKILNSKIV